MENINLQGMEVLRVWRGSAYLRIPSELRRVIDGGCGCTYCKTHPAETPTWDTLGVPLIGQRRSTWTLHAPEWRAGDKADETPTLLRGHKGQLLGGRGI